MDNHEILRRLDRFEKTQEAIFGELRSIRQEASADRKDLTVILSGKDGTTGLYARIKDLEHFVALIKLHLGAIWILFLTGVGSALSGFWTFFDRKP